MVLTAACEGTFAPAVYEPPGKVPVWELACAANARASLYMSSRLKYPAENTALPRPSANLPPRVMSELHS